MNKSIYFKTGKMKNWKINTKMSSLLLKCFLVEKVKAISGYEKEKYLVTNYNS